MGSVRGGIRIFSYGADPRGPRKSGKYKGSRSTVYNFGVNLTSLRLNKAHRNHTRTQQRAWMYARLRLVHYRSVWGVGTGRYLAIVSHLHASHSQWDFRVTASGEDQTRQKSERSVHIMNVAVSLDVRTGFKRSRTTCHRRERQSTLFTLPEKNRVFPKTGTTRVLRLWYISTAATTAVGLYFQSKRSIGQWCGRIPRRLSVRSRSRWYNVCSRLKTRNRLWFAFS